MKILGYNNINEVVDEAKENVEDLIFKSRIGDINASIQLIFYYIVEDEGISKRAIRYILTSIEQGNSFLAEIMADMYLKGSDSEQLKIAVSPEKAFKLFLKSSSFSSFKHLREIAGEDDRMWRQIVNSALQNKLHPAYNNIISAISKSLPDDITRVKSYTKVIDDTALFFVELRRKMVIESNLLERESKMLTHYTDINALRSMLQLDKTAVVSESDKKGKPVIRLYNVAYMNDPEEGMFLFNNELKELGEYLVEENYYNTYLSSFTSGDIDDLTMWRLYGRDGKGISITSPTKDLFPQLAACEMCCKDLQSFIEGRFMSDASRNEINICLYKVKYDCTEIQEEILSRYNKLKDAIAENDDNQNLELVNVLKQSFVKVSDEVRFLYKSEQYKVESEYRLLSFHQLDSPMVKLDERENPRLYLNSLPIFGEGTIINIGPKVEDKVVIKLELEYRLKKYGFNGVTVKFSEAKYR